MTIQKLSSGRIRRPDVVAEHVVVRLERDHDHVVDRRQRPDDQDDAERQRRRLRSDAAAPVIRAAAAAAGAAVSRFVEQDRGHSCTSEVRSLCISIITSGIISGKADITAATPSSGRAISNASRMPSVASTCVDNAGPPPETKYAVLKSPSVKIVESSVQTR